MSFELGMLLACAVHVVLGCGAVGFLVGTSEEKQPIDLSNPSEAGLIVVMICLWPLVLAFFLAANAGEAWRDRAKRQKRQGRSDVDEL